MSKYEKLWKYIKKRNKEELVLTFEEIKKILDFEIDHSFLTYKKELEDYGYQVEKISMKNQKIIIKKKEEKYL